MADQPVCKRTCAAHFDREMVGRNDFQQFLDLMKGKLIIIGLRFEHRSDLQINHHYIVEPWHENTNIC